MEYLIKTWGRVAPLPFDNKQPNKQQQETSERRAKGENSILSAAFVVQIEAGHAINVLTRVGGTLMLRDSHVGAACGTSLEGRLPITQVIKARCSFLLAS